MVGLVLAALQSFQGLMMIIALPAVFVSSFYLAKTLESTRPEGFDAELSEKQQYVELARDSAYYFVITVAGFGTFIHSSGYFRDL